MRVVFTDRARKDLRAIAFYIAKDNPARAKTFVEHLREKAREIGRHPSAFPALEMWGGLGVRRRVVGNFLILYQIQDDATVILRIVHGARDYAEDFR